MEVGFDGGRSLCQMPIVLFYRFIMASINATQFDLEPNKMLHFDYRVGLQDPDRGSFYFITQIPGWPFPVIHDESPWMCIVNMQCHEQAELR